MTELASAVWLIGTQVLQVGLQHAAMTPTTDTNRLGQCCTRMDSDHAPPQALDGAGHLGHALQAGGRGFESP
jgi:hypothetical protein